MGSIQLQTIGSKSLIINLKNYGSLIVNDKTGFDDAIIDDSNFIDYIAGFIKNPPVKIANRNELKVKLEAAGYSKAAVDYVLRTSKLLK